MTTVPKQVCDTGHKVRSEATTCGHKEPRNTISEAYRVATQQYMLQYVTTIGRIDIWEIQRDNKPLMTMFHGKTTGWIIWDKSWLTYLRKKWRKEAPALVAYWHMRHGR